MRRSPELDIPLQHLRRLAEDAVRTLQIVELQCRVSAAQALADLVRRARPGQRGRLRSVHIAPLRVDFLALDGRPALAERPPAAHVRGAPSADVAHLRHRGENMLRRHACLRDGRDGLQALHVDEYCVDVARLHRVRGAVEHGAHGEEPVAERSHLDATEVRGVLAPEAHRVVLPDGHARVPGEGIGHERLEGHAVHRLHQRDERREQRRDGHLILAHPPPLHGDVIAPLAQQTLDHVDDEARALEVHLAGRVVDVADGHERLDHLELARVFHAQPEDLGCAHHGFPPRHGLCLVVRIDDEVTAVEARDRVLGVVDRWHLYRVVHGRSPAHRAGGLQESAVHVAVDQVGRHVALARDVVEATRLVVVPDLDRSEGEGVAGHDRQDEPAGADFAEPIVRADLGRLAGVALGEASCGDGREVW